MAKWLKDNKVKVLPCGREFATQTNMESERDTEHGDTEHRDTELVPKRGATTVTWTWFGYEKSDTDQQTVLCKNMPQAGPDNRLKHH